MSRQATRLQWAREEGEPAAAEDGVDGAVRDGDTASGAVEVGDDKRRQRRVGPQLLLRATEVLQSFDSQHSSMIEL